MPAAYVCAKLAPLAVLVVVLSPKSQDRFGSGDPVEASVKVTAKGSVPLMGLAVKPATGDTINVRVALVLVAVPALLLTTTE